MGKIELIKKVISRLRFILDRRQKKLGILVLLCSFINAILQTLGVSAIVPVILMMTDQEAAMEKPSIAFIAKLLHADSFGQIFVVLCIGIALLYIFKNVFCLFQSWLNIKYSNKIQKDLSLKMLGSYLSRNYSFFLKTDSGKIMRDVTGDPSGISVLLNAGMLLINEVLTMVLILLYIILSDPMMALCIGVIALLCLLIINFVFRRKMKQNGIIAREATAERNKILIQTVGGIKEVQVMRKQGYFASAFHETILRLQKTTVVSAIGNTAPGYVIEALFVSGIMIYLALRSVFDPNFVDILPLMASFALGAIRMLPSLGRISSSLNTITFQLPCLDSIFGSLKNFSDCNAEMLLNKEQEALSLKTGFEAKLELEDISWRYENTDRDVLHGLNLVIKKGQSVGIIGASGAGKSTLSDIILGLHHPQKGQVLIDGININTIPDDWSRIVGFVPQGVFLIDGTVRENIAFGVNPKEIDDDAIWKALEQAQLKDFVMDTEKGLDTVVGERGIRFSGGQKQRMAIARALYRKPQILVLDEATSALDNETEEAVIEAIEGLYGTITMIIIAHRLTTIRKCDVVYEIIDGIAVQRESIGI